MVVPLEFSYEDSQKIAQLKTAFALPSETAAVRLALRVAYKHLSDIKPKMFRREVG